MYAAPPPPPLPILLPPPAVFLNHLPRSFLSHLNSHTKLKARQDTSRCPPTPKQTPALRQQRLHFWGAWNFIKGHNEEILSCRSGNQSTQNRLR